MIGGTDIVLRTTGDPAALDICARIVVRYWPRARFEDAITGDKYEQYGDMPLGGMRELFVYRDAQSECAWDADDGDSPENSMLYLILSSDSVTVVLDDPNTAEMRSMVSSLRVSLETAVAK